MLPMRKTKIVCVLVLVNEKADFLLWSAWCNIENTLVVFQDNCFQNPCILNVHGTVDQCISLKITDV